MNVVLARIGKPHGLRGEVTVQLHTDDPETRFAVGTVVATEAEPGSGVPTALTIASTRVHRGIWLLTFEEIPDRTGAESLRGTRLVRSGSTPRPTTRPLRGRSRRPRGARHRAAWWSAP